ncbi:MAG: rhodanese-like domain-containing protein [Ignavibacteria bacterium]
MNKTIKEVFIIFTAALVTGLIANFISPRGIALIRDDSSRYVIDSAGVNNGFDIKKRGKLNKAGFYEPVNIPVEVAKQLFDDNVKFIDGREDFEFKEGRIKGAINISYKEFKDKTIEQKQQIMKDLNKEQMLVSYCSSDSCEISIDNAYEMAKAGYNDIKIYLGGYKEWTKLGYPAEK